MESIYHELHEYERIACVLDANGNDQIYIQSDLASTSYVAMTFMVYGITPWCALLALIYFFLIRFF